MDMDNWTTWTKKDILDKLDNMNKIGQTEQNQTIWKKLTK